MIFALSLAVGAFAAGPSHSADGGAEAQQARPSLPASGTLISVRSPVHAAPSSDARRVAVLREFRPDFRKTTVYVTDARVVEDALWYRVLLQTPKNGEQGWIKAARTRVAPVSTRIVVRLRKRDVRVYVKGKLRFKTRAAIGKPEAPTPVGHFYITAGFRPTVPMLGRYAFETSAYANVTDWPGGGLIGLHGTTRTDLLGKSVSSGCIRVSNAAIMRIRQLVGPGASFIVRR